MFKNISKYVWFDFLPTMVFAIVAIYLLIMGVIPIYYLGFTLISWILFAGLGVAVGYHRVFSHNTHPNLPLWKENVMLFFGAMSGQGSSVTWTAIHIGNHHPHSDTDRDLHTPNKSVFHAFIGWSLKLTEVNGPNLVNLKYAVRQLRKPNHIWFHKNYRIIYWSTPIVLALLFGWKIALMASLLPSALALLQDNTVNVLGHRKGFIGYRNYETKDNSQNNLILGYLAWGQGWHNNHHYDPKSFDFGTRISGKWYEFDPCKIFLPFLK
jgi:stearoyl-CoA desaturase (delta-9 desaturase)